MLHTSHHSRASYIYYAVQVTHMGFKADVIVWQFKERELYCRLSLHMVKVQAVTFSPNDKFLATLGGQDDNR